MYPRSACRLAYKLWGEADYVQPGLLSHSEQARLDSMQVQHVVAEVAAASTRHRNAAATRAGGGYWGVLAVEQNNRTQWRIRLERKGTVHVQKLYASPEEAAQAWDALAWECNGWCAAAARCMLGACESCMLAFCCMIHILHDLQSLCGGLAVTLC